MARKKKSNPVVEEFQNIELIIPKFYVYYDNKTGQILSITNEVDPNFEYSIEVDHDEIAGFFTSEKSWNDYIVARVKTTDGSFITQIILKTSPIYDFKNNDLIHIRTNLSDTPDLLVVWNGPKTYWEFSLNSSAREFFNNKIRRGSVMFFVTLEDDFDFLIKTIAIKTDDLLNGSTISIPFDTNYEFNNAKISISTVSLFRSYNLKIYE